MMNFVDEHSIHLNELAARLESDLNNGLTEAQAAHKLEIFGPNELSPPKLLIISSLFSACMTPIPLAFLIGSLLNSILYFRMTSSDIFQFVGAIFLLGCGVLYSIAIILVEKRKSLKKKIRQPAQILCTRDGMRRTILESELVPGDIIHIRAGDRIPADIRIFDSNEMKIDNSAFTEETDLVSRTQECTHQDSPMESMNLCFMGSTCREGEGRGIVVFTGDRTLFAAIASLAAALGGFPHEESDSLLARESNVAKLWALISIMAFQCCLVLAGYGFFMSLLLGILMFSSELSPKMIWNLLLGMSRAAPVLLKRSLLINNLSIIEKLAAATVICTEKMSALSENRMTVSHLWYNRELKKGHNRQKMGLHFKYEYDIESQGFQDLHKAAILSSDAVFQEDSTQELCLDRTATGTVSEVAMIRFFQPIEDVKLTRAKHPVVASLPFTAATKYIVKIVKYRTDDSDYCIFIMGPPEKINSMCSHFSINGELFPIDEKWNHDIEKTLVARVKKGERLLAFAKYPPPRNDYPEGFKFNCTTPFDANFPLNKFSFCGMITLRDPPRDNIDSAIAACKRLGIKTVMTTGDTHLIATPFARELGIISERVVTVNEIMNAQNISLDEAMEKSEAIVIHGDMRKQALEYGESERVTEWLDKPQVIFVRLTPSQKLAVVDNYQKMGHTVIAVGAGVSDCPALRQADVGVTLGRSGTGANKDVAHVILLDDNFPTLVEAIKTSRAISKNILEAAAMSKVSSIPQLIFLLASMLLGIPISETVIFLLILSLGRNISRECLLSSRNNITSTCSPPFDSILNQSLSQSYVNLWNGIFQALSMLVCYLLAENMSVLVSTHDANSVYYKTELMRYTQVASLLGILAIRVVIMAFDCWKMKISLTLENKKALYEFVLVFVFCLSIMNERELNWKLSTLLLGFGLPNIALGFFKLVLDEVIQHFYLKSAQHE